MYSPTQPIFLFSIINVIELRFIDKPGSILTFPQKAFLILAFFRCSLFSLLSPFLAFSFFLSRFLFLALFLSPTLLILLSLSLNLYLSLSLNLYLSLSLNLYLCLSLSFYLPSFVSLCPPISLCLSVCLEQFIFYSHQILFFTLSIYSQQYNNIYTYNNLTSFVYFC